MDLKDEFKAIFTFTPKFFLFRLKQDFGFAYFFLLLKHYWKYEAQLVQI